MNQWMNNVSKGLALTISPGIQCESQSLTLSSVLLCFRNDFGGSKGIQQCLLHYIEDDVKSSARNFAASLPFHPYEFLPCLNGNFKASF